jgi:hypothetical protein
MPTRETVSILDGSTFVVSDTHGDIDAGQNQPHGFFYRDTRFLSRWRLHVGDGDLDVLSNANTDYFAAQFFLYPRTGTVHVEGARLVRTSCEHKRDHGRPRAGHISSSDSRGLRGFRALAEPRVPALPSPEPEW